ncbi:metal-dependent hydrolase [Paenibacillus sp.]|uniref:metal-dependent hydrolase n=1 Tax=Paenibacillus sp. TaxID=58172 RepID=UPI002D40C303|nr:metal-dependent hydrolase [Paenibacillus sp.]HZG57596.1 metal-dependent hydrolase [Paenibacillus sp.]
MDTATHFAFGFGLAGLSQIDPNVSTDVWATAAVMIATVAGSQAPDADTLVRFRGNELYVRHHRGMSHSIPAWFAWTALISSLVWLAFPAVPFATIALWTFVAVTLHVAVDLFNTYGTQAFRPLTSRWIAWNVIHIFDPFLFGAHAVALGLWALGLGDAAVLFPSLYGLLAVYYVWRVVIHRRTERALPKLDPTHRGGDRYTAIPTVKWTVWNVVRRNAEGNYTIGVLDRGGLRWTDEYVCESSPLIEASKKHPAVDAFLSFSSHPCPQSERRGSDTIVRWVDARYQHRKHYPFLAVVKYNRNQEPVFSYVGWISDEKLEEKLRSTPSHSMLSAAGR